MTPTRPESKCVTWPQFLTAIISIVVALGGLQTFVWAQHSAHTHAGAYTKDEARQLEARMLELTRGNRADNRRMEAKIDQLLAELRNR